MLDTLIVLLFNCLRKVKRLNGLEQCSKGGAARASISRAVTVMINTGIHVHSIMADSIWPLTAKNWNTRIFTVYYNRH